MESEKVCLIQYAPDEVLIALLLEICMCKNMKKSACLLYWDALLHTCSSACNALCRSMRLNAMWVSNLC